MLGYLTPSREAAPAAAQATAPSPAQGLDNSTLLDLMTGGRLGALSSWWGNGAAQEQLHGNGASDTPRTRLERGELSRAMEAHRDEGWADLREPDFLDAYPLHATEGEMAKKNAAYRLSRQHRPNAIDDDFADPSAPVNLSDTAARLATLDGFTQNQNSTEGQDQKMCGATALLGGVMLADGERGIETLLTALDGGTSQDPEIASIRKRIAAGEAIDRGDLDFVQTHVHRRLMQQEGQDPDRPADQTKGIKGDTIRGLLGGNKELRNLFLDNDMSVDGVDLGGENGTQLDHWVLSVKGGDGATAMVYDPWVRRGGQVTGRAKNASTLEDYQTNDSTLSIYDYATRVRINGA